MLRFAVAPIIVLTTVWAVTEANTNKRIKPADKPAVSRTGSALTDAEANELVECHNKARKEVGVGPVKWSKDIAKHAQEWADKLAEAGELAHRHPNQYGENLAIAKTVLQGAELWYREKKDYKPGTPVGKEGFSTVHYTAMVWSTTTEIGAGKAVTKKGTVIVCNYSPMGNVLGMKPY